MVEFQCWKALGGQRINFPDLSQDQLYLIHPSHKNSTSSPAICSNDLESFLLLPFLASHGLSGRGTENRLLHFFM